jgi:hypothetical protein
MPELTPRLVLQLWGTEVCRRSFHDDIWIASLEARLLNTQDNIVISDCRFPNEIKAIKNAGGQVIWVQRGIMPHWYDIAVQANKGSRNAIEWLKTEGIHASETAWVGTTFDAIVDNDHSIEDLYKQLAKIVQ